jgi:hypothetical protein
MRSGTRQDILYLFSLCFKESFFFCFFFHPQGFTFLSFSFFFLNIARNCQDYYQTSRQPSNRESKTKPLNHMRQCAVLLSLAISYRKACMVDSPTHKTYRTNCVNNLRGILYEFLYFLFHACIFYIFLLQY